MSINRTIKVENDPKKPDDVNDLPAIDQTQDTIKQDPKHSGDEKLEPGSYEGSKYQPDIDGPMEDSQETDDVYEDGRVKDAGLPPAGKNVGDLNAYDLGRHDKD